MFIDSLVLLAVKHTGVVEQIVAVQSSLEITDFFSLSTLSSIKQLAKLSVISMTILCLEIQLRPDWAKQMKQI